MRPSRILLILGGVTVWLLAFVGLYHVVGQHLDHVGGQRLATPNTNPPNPLFMVAYLAALIALAGWMVQAWVSMRNSKKQHTINLLFQYRMHSQYSEHIANIKLYYPGLTPIKFEELNSNPDGSVLESVRFTLNFYELMAAGIRHGDLDIGLLRDSLCTQFLIFCNRCEDVIRSVRQEDSLGRPAPDKARLFRNLRWLQRKWAKHAGKGRRLPLRARIADFFRKIWSRISN